MDFAPNDDLINAQKIKLKIQSLKLSQDSPQIHLVNSTTSTASPSKPKRVYKTPAVDKLKKKLEQIKLNLETKRKTKVLLKRTKDPLTKTIDAEYRQVKKMKFDIEKKMNNKIRYAPNQRKWRANKRRQDKKQKNY